jgi:hypothetical protein
MWPRGLRRRSAAARLLRLWVRISPRAGTYVRCECCVLSGRGLCDELITRPEESYRLWCVVVCDIETSWMRMPRPTGGLSRQSKQGATARGVSPRKVGASCTLSTTTSNTMWSGLGLHRGLRGERVVCNRLSHATASHGREEQRRVW